MAILSIQSHVAYGYVGNKAAVFPLQSMGYDVWPVNTVQFSNHTGYGRWQGEVFSSAHVRDVIAGLEDLGVTDQCNAILSGYMGSADICHEVQQTVLKFKANNPDLLYLCDPVIGNTSCFVKPEVLDFFKTHLRADIITPNQFEAETLSGRAISDRAELKRAADYFHALGVKIVVITGVKLPDLFDHAMAVVVSQQGQLHAIKTQEFDFAKPPNGTGDLFSAVFLGSYLATLDAVDSLRRTVYFTDQVMKHTFESGGRELKIISVHYRLVTVGELPTALAL